MQLELGCTFCGSLPFSCWLNRKIEITKSFARFKMLEMYLCVLFTLPQLCWMR